MNLETIMKAIEFATKAAMIATGWAPTVMTAVMQSGQIIHMPAEEIVVEDADKVLSFGNGGMRFARLYREPIVALVFTCLGETRKRKREEEGVAAESEPSRTLNMIGFDMSADKYMLHTYEVTCHGGIYDLYGAKQEEYTTEDMMCVPIDSFVAGWRSINTLLERFDTQTRNDPGLRHEI